MATRDASNDLEKLLARLDLYEQSITQLKKDLPVYFQKYNDTSKSVKTMATTVRNLGSCESDINLQKSLFTLAQSFEHMDTSIEDLVKTDAEIQTALEEVKKMALAPYREILNDAMQTRKSITDPCLLEYTIHSMAVNQELFEHYRVKYLKVILTKYIHSNLKYHCRAVEDFTSALQTIQSWDI